MVSRVFSLVEAAVSMRFGVARVMVSVCLRFTSGRKAFSATEFIPYNNRRIPMLGLWTLGVSKFIERSAQSGTAASI